MCQTEHEHLYIFFVKVETLAPIQSKAMHCTPRDKQSNACRSDESIAIVVSSTKMVVSVSDTHSGKSLRNITNKDRPRLDPWFFPIFSRIIMEYVPSAWTTCTNTTWYKSVKNYFMSDQSVVETSDWISFMLVPVCCTAPSPYITKQWGIVHWFSSHVFILGCSHVAITSALE